MHYGTTDDAQVWTVLWVKGFFPYRTFIREYLDRVEDPYGYRVRYGYYPGTGLLKDVTGSDGVAYAGITDYGTAGQVGNGLITDSITY